MTKVSLKILSFEASTLSQTLRNSSFTNGIQMFSRIAVLVVLCCSIGVCQGRQNGLPRSESAFVHHSTLGLSRKMYPFASSTKPLDVLSEAAVPAVTGKRSQLFMSSEMRDETDGRSPSSNKAKEDLAPTSTGQSESDENVLAQFLSFLQFDGDEYKKPPPFQVEDTSLLFYDVFLILNLSLSISFWAVHRMSFDYIGSAVSEGSLFCLLWIAAGLVNGAFLYSAVDGHYGSTDERGGPKAAGLLGLHTFISASSLRIIVALAMAVLEHRKVGIAGEQLIPLEIAFGLVLMSLWRTLHSTYTPRV